MFLWGLTTSAQTINQYLNGIWKMECCDPDFWVIHNNKLYWINEKNVAIVKNPILNYCIPKTATFTEDSEFNRIYKKTVPIDSVDFDRPFKLNDIGMELLYLLEYTNDDVINGREIKINDIGSSLNYYYIDPKESNRYYVWDDTAPSKIVYYYRILSPPKYVLDFYKKIAFESFKKIRFQKRFILDDSFTLTKMYLIEGDEVEVLEQKLVKGINWLKIRYYGSGATPRKTIEGWIKKNDVE